LVFKIRKSIQNKGSYEEIILALNPTSEGYLTSLYLKKILEPYRIKITQIGVGIPYGGEIEFADPETIKEAMKRRE
jgi:recombination protein RecR